VQHLTGKNQLGCKKNREEKKMTNMFGGSLKGLVGTSFGEQGSKILTTLQVFRNNKEKSSSRTRA
jgi:hypothetical protein